MRVMLSAVLLGTILALSPSSGWCSDPDQGLDSVGVRGGFTATSRRSEFHQYEAYATYGLPWSVRNESGWGLQLQTNVAAGTLHSGSEDSFIGTLGPGLVFDKAGRKGVALDMGGDLCFLSRYRFRKVDFNGNPLFEGHLGIAYRFGAGPGISYRFQHMSNGGLGRHGDLNTGLDLHMFGASWHF